MQDFNEIRITGTLYNEPSCAQTVTGGTLSKFSVGVKRPDPSKAIDFMNVIAWNEGANFVEEHFHEHSRITVKGKLHLDKYKSQDGTDKKIYRIVANEIEDPDDPDISYSAMKLTDQA